MCTYIAHTMLDTINTVIPKSASFISFFAISLSFFLFTATDLQFPFFLKKADLLSTGKENSLLNASYDFYLCVVISLFCITWKRLGGKLFTTRNLTAASLYSDCYSDFLIISKILSTVSGTKGLSLMQFIHCPPSLAFAFLYIHKLSTSYYSWLNMKK